MSDAKSTVKVRLVGPRGRLSTSTLKNPDLPTVRQHARSILLVIDIRDGEGRRFSQSEYDSNSFAEAERNRIGWEIQVGDGTVTEAVWAELLSHHHAHDNADTDLLVEVSWIRTNK